MLSRPALFISFILLVFYGYFFPRWADWNENSHLDQTLAIVDHGTLDIDAYHENTGDLAYYNGHYYSEKAPGLAILAVPVYWTFKVVAAGPLNTIVASRVASNAAFAETLNASGTGRLTDKVNFFLALVFVTFFVVAVPSALLGAAFYGVLGAFSSNTAHKVALTLAYGLATPAVAYASNFYSHQLSAALLFGAFYLLFQNGRALGRSGPRAAALLVLAGLLLGFAVITEYPTAIVAAGLGVYAWFQIRSRQYASLMGGALLPLTLHVVYTTSIYGSPFAIGYGHVDTFKSVQSVGVLGVHLPSLEALWGITFSPYRGLFFLSPFLLLGLIGLPLWGKEGHNRRELLLFTWTILSYLIFVSSYEAWSGGFAVGPRHLVPMLPFLALPIILCWNRRRSPWLQLVAWLAVAWSAVATWAETIGGQMFPQFQGAPLWEYSVPSLAAGDIARNAGMIFGLAHWSSLVPLTVLGAIAVALALRGHDRTTPAAVALANRT